MSGDIVSGIYLIINCENGKIYIGSSINIEERFYFHCYYLSLNKHKNPHLQASWNFYGADSFHFCIVEECSIDRLLEIEQAWLDGSFGENCYNASPTAGNTLGVACREETKEKISKANKGHKKNFTKEYRLELAKRGIAALAKINEQGLAYTPEARTKMTEKLKGNKHRRRENKWPHAWGSRCPCEECSNKKREYSKNRSIMKKNGTWIKTWGREI